MSISLTFYYFFTNLNAFKPTLSPSPNYAGSIGELPLENADDDDSMPRLASMAAIRIKTLLEGKKTKLFEIRNYIINYELRLNCLALVYNNW